MTFPFLGYSQVQYTIADVPVCWSVGGTDSSIVKFTIVTTQGAFLDLGYFDPGGNPVTVTGGTVKTGFCVPSDSLSIDSTGRTFTLNIGDQSVSWNAGAEYYAQLLDVDTAGVDTNYIAKYSPSVGGWKMYDNNLDGLTDVVFDNVQNNLIIGDTTNIPFLPGSDNNSNLGIGRVLFNGFTFGYEVLGIGTAPLNKADSTWRVVSIGKNTGGGYGTGIGLNYKNKHRNSVFLGQFAGGLDSLTENTIMFGEEANMKLPYDNSNVRQTINGVLAGSFAKMGTSNSRDEIAIGAYVVGKGDSTVTLGLPFYKGTYLNGNLNLNGYGAGNKLPGLIAKTGSPYLALLATDGTITEIHRDSVGGGGSTTLSGLTDVTLTSPQAGEVLIYNGTDWVNDTVVNTLTAVNGLRNAGTLINPEIRLGDTLIEDTEVTQLGFDMIFDQSAASTGIFRAGSVDSFGVYAEINQNKNGRITLFSGYSGDVQVTGNIALATKNVQDSVAAPGMFLKLIDVQNGRVEWDTVPTGGGGGFTLPTDSITFNDNPRDAVAGKLQRDDNVGTLVYGSPTGVPLRTAGTLGWYVKNQTGSQIDKGTVVRAAGTVGNSDQILIDKMIADGSIEAKFTLGITAEDIANGADGWVFDHGKIKPLDLSAYNSGAVLYVSTTVPGGLTDTVPVAPDLVLPIGFVVDSTSNGTLAVRTGIQTTVSASNGLTAMATADNSEIKLGGDLTQFTEIDGSNTYGIRFDSLGSFSAFSKGDTRLRSDSTTWGVISNLWFDDLNGLLLETYSSSTLSNTQLFFPRTGQAKFSQTRNYNGINYQNTIQLHQGATTFEAVNVDSSEFTKLQFTPEKIFLDANTVGSDGWVLTLIDSATTEIDYRPLNGIEQDTAAAIDFENLPNKIYQFDFTGKASATVSFTNVKTASVYVIHVLNSNAGDVITWPADCKTETGATLTSTTLAGAGRIFTMYFDGTNYYIK